jgi:hypothetical protein
MVDREKVVAVLKRRFPGAAAEQVAAATNAIVGLDDEWVELSTVLAERDGTRPVTCRGSCYLADAARRDGRFKVFKRVGDNDDES